MKVCDMSIATPKNTFPMVVKQPLSAQDTASLYDAIKRSDENATVLIELLAEDYNLSSTRRVTKDVYIENKEEFLIPDTLDAYLHAVYHGAFSSARALVRSGMEHGSASQAQTQSHFNPSMKMESTGSSLVFDGANDVCMAILSNHKNALKNLVKMYEDLGLDLDLNRKTATPASVSSFSDTNAKCLQPLDIALMRYVAEAIKQKEFYEENAPKIKQMEDSQRLAEKIADKFAENSGLLGFKTISFNTPSAPKLKPYANDTMNNIELLMSLGATGSENAYFPFSDESLHAPFTCDDSFERMSYKTFCTMNSEAFTPAFRQKLLGEPDLDALFQMKNAKNLTR